MENRFAGQITIDLSEGDIPISELTAMPYLCKIIFVLSISSNLAETIAKMLQYIPFIQEMPLIATQFVLKGEQKKIQEEKHFKVAAVGGTFDHLHIGHQILLLNSALRTKEELYVGITGEEMLLKKQNKQMIQSFEIRKAAVVQFLHGIKPNLKINIAKLEQPYGPTIIISQIEGLILSEETQKACQKINEIRASKGFNQLRGVICETISISGIENKLSSSAIRNWILKKNNLSIQQFAQYKSYWLGVIAELKQIFTGGSEKTGTVVEEKWWNIIVASYSEHWRHYHTNLHIYTMLKQCHSSKFESQSKQDRITLILSILFHDIIYLPYSSKNQEESAQKLGEFMDQFGKWHILNHGQHQKLTNMKNQIFKVILETKDHEVSTPISQRMYDLDMAILNQNRDTYSNYAQQIKKQYQPIVKEEYPSKRKQFLEGLLNKKPKYSFQPSNYFQNIKWEIELLK